MVTDLSRRGTLVGQSLLRRDSMPLMKDTTISFGNESRIGFHVHLPNHTKHQELYKHNYRQYAEKLGCQPDAYLPTPSAAVHLIPLGANYSIFDGIGRGNFGVVNTVVRTRDGCVFAVKETKAKEINGQVTFPREVEIMQKLSHVSYYSTVLAE
jgi:hypothetical protein